MKTVFLCKEIFAIARKKRKYKIERNIKEILKNKENWLKVKSAKFPSCDPEYPQLITFLGLMAPFPFSKVVVEGFFSLLKLVKSYCRNRLSMRIIGSSFAKQTSTEKSRLLYKTYATLSGGARSRNLGGHLRSNTHFWGGKIEFHEISPSPRCQNFLPPGFFSIHFSRNFFPDISNFSPDL